MRLDEAIDGTADAGFEAIELACTAPHLDVATAQRDAGRLVERILTRTVEAGVPLSLSWQAGPDITPGLYWWRLEAGALSTGRAMVLVR